MTVANDIRSLLSSTLDLLHYHRWGNFGLFDRCFRKSCDLHELKFVDEMHFRKLRTFGFAFLRNSGFIDVFNSGTITQWSVSNNCLVQLNDKKFAIIGSSVFCEEISGMFPRSVEIQWPNGYFPELPNNVNLYPPIPVLNVVAQRVIEVAAARGIHVSSNAQDNLFEALPSLDSVIERIISVRVGMLSFEPDSLEKFCFDEQLWKKYDNVLISHEGIFRRNFDFQAPDYFIGFRRDGKLCIGEVLEREWLLVCGVALLRKQLSMRYRRANNSVSIQMTRGFSLPAVVERCLRSGNLLGPQTSNQWREYSNISEKNFWRLSSSVPIFSLEVS